MAAPIKENLEVEPAVKAGFANRELVRRNLRAQSNWDTLRTRLEKQQKEIRYELDTNKSKLLRQRERIQTTTISLNTQLLPTSNSTSGTKSNDGEMTNLSKPLSFVDVYKALMASRTEQKKSDSFDLKSASSETTNLSKSTQSSEKKKVARKPMGFTLGKLQRENSNLSSRLKSSQNEETFSELFENAATEEETPRMPGLLELNEEDEALGPLYLPPVMLPPIRKQVVYKPQGQNLDKNSKEYKQKQSNSCTVDDVRYCRYLRSGRRMARRHSAPLQVENMTREVYRKDSH